jgi:hypothetical protein
MRVEGTITLASPLPNDAALQTFSISAYDFTDGVRSYAYAAPVPDDGSAGTVQLRTDASGAIVGWSMDFKTADPPGCGCGSAVYDLVTQNPQTGLNVFDFVLVTEFNGGVHVAARAEAPGAWTLVPEPSVLTLSAFGMISLVAAMRRR